MKETTEATVLTEGAVSDPPHDGNLSPKPIKDKRNKKPEIAFSQSPISSASHEWNKACRMLSQNPKLLTTEILLIAIQRQAPHNLISFMLKLNPAVAAVPKQGPAPLQVALENYHSIEIIEELLQACPVALVAPGSDFDPLSYAKEHWSDETELIELLSRPMNSWLQRDTEDPTCMADTSKDTIATCNLSPIKKVQSDALSCGKENTRNKYNGHLRTTKGTERGPSEQSSVRPILRENSSDDPGFFLSKFDCGRDTTIPSVTVAPQVMHPVGNNTEDPGEIKNVKLICMSVLKGHKRLAKDMAEMQKRVDGLIAVESKTSLPNIALMIQSHGDAILQQVKEKQKKFAQSQVIALQQGERKMKEFLYHAEVRLAHSIVQRQQETHGKMEMHMDAVVKGLQMRLAKFSKRIEFLEQLVYPAEMKRASSRMRNSDRPPSVVSFTVPISATSNFQPEKDVPDTIYDSPRNEAEEGSHTPRNTTGSKIKSVSPNEFDDKRSLLTVETAVDRSDCNTTHCRTIIAPKKRWFHIIRKRSVVNTRSTHA